MMIIAGQFADGAAAQEFAITLPARLKTFARHAARRPNGIDGVLRIRDVEGAELRAEETARRERFELLRFAHAFEPLPDVDEGRNSGIVGAAHSGNPRADMRTGNRLRRNIAGMPVILMPRVENVAQVRHVMG